MHTHMHAHNMHTRMYAHTQVHTLEIKIQYQIILAVIERQVRRDWTMDHIALFIISVSSLLPGAD